MLKFFCTILVAVVLIVLGFGGYQIQQYTNACKLSQAYKMDIYQTFISYADTLEFYARMNGRGASIAPISGENPHTYWQQLQRLSDALLINPPTRSELLASRTETMRQLKAFDAELHDEIKLYDESTPLCNQERSKIPQWFFDQKLTNSFLDSLIQ